jgi:cardiolipin synthase C
MPVMARPLSRPRLVGLLAVLFKLIALSLLLVFGLSACGSLPERVAPPASWAFADTQGSTLARIAAASLRFAPDAASITAPPAPGQASQAALPSPAETGWSGFRLLPTGEFAFDARTALAARAERSLDAQYYHVHADPAGSSFLRELRDAAQRGVRVRLLIDDFHAAEVYDLLQGLAAHANVEVRLFNPLLARRGTPLHRMLLSLPEFARVNHRMHNKLFVADNAVAIYGGRNVADEYFSRHGVANFVDLDVISVGPVVQDLSASFDRYWNSEPVWALHQVLPTRIDAASLRADFARRVAANPLASLSTNAPDPLRQSAVSTQLALGYLQMLPGTAQVMADPPEKVGAPVIPNTASAAMQAKLDVIAAARQEVAIVSPYFLPGEVGMRMMAEATRQGVKALVVTNSLGSIDEPLVHRAYSRYRADMLKLGVQLYEFGPELAQRSGGFGNFGLSTPRLHVKAAVVDRRWLLVGSVNLDARSAILNTELGVAIDSPPLAEQALGLLRADQFASMYRLQLAQDGRRLRWHIQHSDGRAEVRDDEPHQNLWLEFKLWLQAFFVSEDSL